MLTASVFLAQEVATNTGVKLNRAILKMRLTIIACPQTNTFEHFASSRAGSCAQSK
jgi:hypothetical protein